MTTQRLTSALTLLFLLAFLVVAAADGLHADDSLAAPDFQRDVRPILSENCFTCHGPDAETREAGLRLDTFEGATARRDGAAAVTPGRPNESELIARITAKDPHERMPPLASDKTLSAHQVIVLRRWIEDGAPYAKHWSFEPVRSPEPPPTRFAEWTRGAIDRFVAASLESHGLEPSREADRVTLARRLSLDLTGLSPSPELVDRFVSDDRPDAYERLVDHLLGSPHFGERWGRHWLDQARYADSHGYTHDSPRTMWPFRDWVIDAFNDDVPFDRFTIEQLAGDLLEKPSTDQLVATGFHRNTLINTEGGSKTDQFRIEQSKDRVDTTGVVWLGLTVGCAKCHTHKYDPVSIEEYYSLFAFFDSTKDQNSVSPTISLPTPDQSRELSELDARIAQLKSAAGDEKRKKEIAALEKKRQEIARRIPQAMVLQELPKPRETYVHLRGDFLRRGDRVEPAGPAVLPAVAKRDGRSNRLDFARWLVSADHPLTPRVRVNRIWMRLFGRGLVETENDFGSQGTLPSHPELLDWLADSFRRGDWSTKRLLRTIVTSATYRQASIVRPEASRVDPRNVLLWRQNRVRVEAEIVRDLALSASGLLTTEIGGPSVYPPQPSGVYAFTQTRKNWKTSGGADRYRRGMYTFFYRTAPHPMLEVLDVPKFNQTCTRRDRSNTPLQSLTIANDEAMVEAAAAFAARVWNDVPDATSDARLVRLMRLAVARTPTSAEVDRLHTHLDLERQRFAESPQEAAEAANAASGFVDDVAPEELAAWISVARVIINLDEFITRE